MTEKEYYHIDKSGLAKLNLIEIKGSYYMISGTESLNSFPNGFITAEYAHLVPYILNENLHKKISAFFKERDLKDIDNVLKELLSNKNCFSDLYFQRILREIIFEVVRLNKFKDKPSRLSCIYLLENAKDIQIWCKYLKANIDNSIIYHFVPTEPTKFKTGRYNIMESKHRADAKWLEINLNNISIIYSNADNYWSSIMTKIPLIEILYYGILKKI
jgi:hypothetical protein